jgi:hypothetical protein
MKSISSFFCATALTTLLAGCGMQLDLGSGSGLRSISIHAGSIAIHARGVPDAYVTAAGDLSIDGKPIPLVPTQRDLLKQYYAQVMLVRDDGVATGNAGAAMAGHALGSVASGLAHGNPDSIGPAIDARAKQVEAKAMTVCTDVVVLRAKQDAIVTVLPAFKPYASINANERTDCQARQD